MHWDAGSVTGGDSARDPEQLVHMSLWNQDRRYNRDEAGPPTIEDDAWFTQHVASLGYPRVKRDPKPMTGQLTIEQHFAEIVASRIEPQPPVVVNPTFDDVVEPWGVGSAPQIRSWAEEHEVHVVDVVEGCWCGEMHK